MDFQVKTTTYAGYHTEYDDPIFHEEEEKNAQAGFFHLTVSDQFSLFVRYENGYVEPKVTEYGKFHSEQCIYLKEDK